jgi:meiotic recombination protein SPO11
MQLATAIEDAVQLLRVPRFQLGIACSSKGLVSGPLLILQPSKTSGRDGTVNCLPRHYPQGFAITGNIKDIMEMKFECHATHIVIVEKDTVFQRLVAQSEKGEEMLRGVLLVTAKGFPDVASRMFVCRIHQMHPHIPIVGICDWNPSGASIMHLYKYGSDRMVESSSCALSDIGWLGIRQSMIREIGHDSFQKMTSRDVKVASGLVKKLKGKNNMAWAEEVECMMISGVKVDIEQLYSSCGFSGLCTIITDMLVERKWV